MAMDISSPIRVMLAVVFGIVLCGLVIIALAATGAFGATASTALTSTATTFTTILPFIGAMVGAGMVMMVMDRRR